MIVMNLNPGQEKMMIRGKKTDQEGINQSPNSEKSKIRDERTNCLPLTVKEKEMITGVNQRDNFPASMQPGHSYNGF
jgi:hypothetical protein